MRRSIAIVGFGRLGKACAKTVLDADDLTLAAVVRGRDHAETALPPPFAGVPVLGDVNEVGGVDAALLCLGDDRLGEVIHALTQHRIATVDSVGLHGEAFRDHWREADRMARHHHLAVVVGAGWDPGALSIFKGLFALLAPKGETRLDERPGVTLHHSLTELAVNGVRRALVVDYPGDGGRRRRYVYVEVEPGADWPTVERAVKAEPLFLDQDTVVLPVDDAAALEEEGHGVVVERHGAGVVAAHQLFLLESRFDHAALTAQMMVAAARALPSLPHGAHSLFDLPLGALWGAGRDKAVAAWI